MFLRGYGSQSFTQNNGIIYGNKSTTYKSGDVGKIQGDGMRHFQGLFGSLYSQFSDCDKPFYGYDNKFENVGLAYARSCTSICTHSERHFNVINDLNYHMFESICGQQDMSPLLYNVTRDFAFDSRRGLPTADEIRPVNIAVRYYIKAK